MNIKDSYLHFYNFPISITTHKVALTGNLNLPESGSCNLTEFLSFNLTDKLVLTLTDTLIQVCNMPDNISRVFMLTEISYRSNDKVYSTCQTNDKVYLVCQTIFYIPFHLTDNFMTGTQLARQYSTYHIT